MTQYGYARVSTKDQNIETQIKQLKEAGATIIYQDKKTGKNMDREGLNDLLSKLKEGDTMVVTKMDRIARNLREGIDLIQNLVDNGIKLHVLNMGLFDGSPTSRLIINILLSVADWEREMMLERQREGIQAAKERGLYKGRPMKYTMNHKGLEYALDLLENREINKLTVNQIAEITKISRASLYRAAKRYSKEETK